jgi:hypothetical protein
MPLFGKSSKSPNEVVRILKDDLLILEKGGENKKLEKVIVSLVSFLESSILCFFFQFALKAQEDLSKQLQAMKGMLFGTESQSVVNSATEQQSDILLAQLSQVKETLKRSVR